MASTLTTPAAIPCQFAEDSQYVNNIPNDPTGSYLASWKEGFPYITMIETALGGSIQNIVTTGNVNFYVSIIVNDR